MACSVWRLNVCGEGSERCDEGSEWEDLEGVVFFDGEGVFDFDADGGFGMFIFFLFCFSKVTVGPNGRMFLVGSCVV
jgi:hypothetical protein